ncbi:MAG: AmmeMemoRadiSam system protein B [Patescibacteria group bacterium]|nr:AmmeMemoRadiSam system protein B [Patescibacteria group bacterium]
MASGKANLGIFVLSLLAAGLIILIAAFLFVANNSANNKNNVTDQAVDARSENFHFAKPDERSFYETAYRFTDKKIDLQDQNVIGGIIPHHLLAADLIAELFSNFTGDYNTVVLIGPNHFFAGQAEIISSAYDWQTPYGVLQCDRNILDELLQFEEIKVEEDIFQKEHAINSEVAFIKKTFPRAKFVPLVLRAGVDEKNAADLARRLANIAKTQKILVLNSVDFSHYKNSATAQAHDKISIQAIEDFDFRKIYDLDIDSPASIYILMKFSELNGAKFILLRNSNSAILSDKPDLKSTTSYVTGYFVVGENH